jgi:mercuric ion binding protein
MKQTLIIFMLFGFLFAEDNIAKYKVKGMQCSQSCPVKITQAINKIDGVKTCDVNFDQKTATVTYDQDKIDSKALAEAINAATNYDVSDNKAEEKKSGSFLQRFFGSS